MKIFGFLLKDGFRVDVEASTPESAYNKLRAISFFALKVTKQYLDYAKDSSIYGWKSISINRK